MSAVFPPRTLPMTALIAALVALVCCSLEPAFAQQKKRRKNDDKQDAARAAKAAEAREQAAIRAANAQIAAAKRVLAAAESQEKGSQSQLKAAVAGLREATKEFDDAQSAARRLAKELTEIEQEILEEQSTDSPYTTAVAAVEEAKLQLKEIADRLLGEKENQQALAGLSGGSLADRKTAILNGNSEYMQAKAKLDSAAAAASELRRELFRADEDWKATAAVLSKARQEENAAEGQTRAGSSERNEATNDLQQAKEAAVAARAAIRRAEAVIERGKANDKGKKSPPKRDDNPPKKPKG